jgi:hypothetical protein
MDGIADDLYRKVRPTERSIELLRSWLTTDQLHQFDEHGWFIVRGSDTGKRYRINSADVAYNIHELDDNGRIVERFCVVPEGNFPIGDIMLTQKIAFETEELKARRVANLHGPNRPRRSPGTVSNIDQPTRGGGDTLGSGVYTASWLGSPKRGVILNVHLLLPPEGPAVESRLVSCLRGDLYYQSLLNDGLSGDCKSPPPQPNNRICHGVGDREHAIWPIVCSQRDVER